MNDELQALMGKITELEGEIHDHRFVNHCSCFVLCALCLLFTYSLASLVIDNLKPLDAGRRCYRMVGGVLVERTVGEVLPAVESNKTKISESVEKLKEVMYRKDKEVREYQAKYKIKFKNSNGLAGNTASSASAVASNEQGVLV
jgi:chaperonin cofactor prefoldin